MSDETRAWRRHLHANPETAFEEHATAAFVASKLGAFGLEVHSGIGGTGVVGVLRGARGAGPSIGLRADMDALDIREENTFPHASTRAGKMHACGHDGHVAMLLGAARDLSRDPDFRGVAHFIFQPGEERLRGGKAMIDDGLFARFPCDQVFGLHNWPELPLGTSAARPGTVMAGADAFRIEVRGRGCHAAMPHLGIDAVYVASQIVVAAQGLVARAADPLDRLVISIPVFRGGEVENVLPETVELAGTVRAFSTATSERVEEQLGRLAGAIAGAHGASAALTYDRRCPPTVNAAEPAAVARAALESVLGAENVLADHPGSMATEDFAFILRERPGCYVFLGQGAPGHSAPVHHPRYDFNDDLLPIGVAYWKALVASVCGG